MKFDKERVEWISVCYKCSHLSYQILFT